MATPPLEAAVDAAWLGLIAGSQPSERNVIVVTYDRHASAFIDAWRDHVEDQPGNLAIIEVGTSMRSTSPKRPSPPETSSENVVHGVADPYDPKEVVKAVRSYLDESSPDVPTVVCVESLSALIRQVDLSTVVRILDAVSSLLEAAGVTGYFHLEATEVDESVFGTLTSLFDTVIQLRDDGTVIEVGPGAPTVRGDECPLSLDDVFDVLRAGRRRMILHYLRQEDGPVEVTDMAEWIAEHETPPGETTSADTIARVYTGLRCTHIPKLEAAGVVSVDEERERISTSDAMATLVPHLRLAAAVDLGARA